MQCLRGLLAIAEPIYIAREWRHLKFQLKQSLGWRRGVPSHDLRLGDSEMPKGSQHGSTTYNTSQKQSPVTLALRLAVTEPPRLTGPPGQSA